MRAKVSSALLFVCALAAAQAPPGAIGDWHFDNNALDASGNGNHGTASNTIPARDRFNRPNMAYKFNGVNSGVVVTHNNSIDIPGGTDFSFAYWQKTYSGNQDAVVITKHQYGNWDGYNFIANNQINPGYCQGVDHMYWYVAAGFQEDACSDTTVLSDSTWHLIVGTFDATAQAGYFYIDGVLQADTGTNSGTTANTANLSFGFDDNIMGGWFHGVLDGARLYPRALNQSEINQLLNECVPSKPVNVTSPGAQVICSNSLATLRATSTETVNWYSSLTSTASIGSGTAFTTPALSPGVYTYYAAGTSTCTSSSRTAIQVTVSACTSVEELLFSNAVLSVYPNPAQGSAFIKTNFPLTDGCEAAIINQLGQEMKTYRLHGERLEMELDLPAGLYTIEIRYKGATLGSDKLIVRD